MMKRRDFLKRSLPVPFMAFTLGGFHVKAYGRSRILAAIGRAANPSDHVLVLVQLNGGNDGLNTVIPLDQYSALTGARGNITIGEGDVLKLTDVTGLHPSMTGMRELYSDGKLAVVQSVGYPNPNFSHFRATDIWLTASDSNVVLTSGWLGRYLDEVYPDFPNGYPNSSVPDPIAIQIGSVVSTGLQGPAVSMGMAITSPTNFYQLVSGGVDTAPNTPAGHELTFIREVALQTQQYASVITTAATKATNKSPLYPTAGTNSLADQLKIVAQLIAGGLRTRIYVVNLGGFDTHSSQVDDTNTETGSHATLLSKLSTAIKAFQDDIRLLGVEGRVVGMTFSEFGRRIKSNASFGTDHGAAAPVFVFGSRVSHEIFGDNPVIPSSATVNDNIPMQYDFRSVYASILHGWFGATTATLNDVLLNNFQELPLIDPVFGKGPLADAQLRPVAVSLKQNYPNPFNPTTRIAFSSNGGHVRLTVFDMTGREVRTLVDGVLPAGEHEVGFDAEGMPTGTYYCRMEAGSFQEVKPMMYLK